MHRIAFALFALLLFIPTHATAAPVKPRNVVVVLLDNFGQEWIGCYGSESGRTPNIDRLAAEGVRAEHCYTPPVCGPSRVVLLTGRYPFRTGYTLHHDAGLYGGGGLDPVRDLVFANTFRSAGYATGVFGKWQINDLYAEPDVLKRHGFDTHVVWPDALDTAKMDDAKWAVWKKAIAEHDVPTTQAMLPLSESRYWDPVVLRDGTREVLTGRYGPDVFQEAAFEFLRANRDKPFLLYCPMVLTHGQSLNEPVVPTPANRDANRPHETIYADMVNYADKLVGDLVAELERLGLRENTLVVVATDNGSESRLVARKNGREVHGGLYSLTEAGIDVGLLFNCPALVPGGRTIPLADFTDVFPTICEFAGLAMPAGRDFDGRSLAPFLLGQAPKAPRDWIFCQYHRRRTVRDDRFKLYSTGELYDVSADPAETTNLAESADPAAVAARARLESILATLPPDSPPPFKLRSQSAFKLETEGKL
jgi:arylsulfatase A-like enzyme